MSIFDRRKKVEKQMRVKKAEVVKMKEQNISYVELANKQLNETLARLNAELKQLETLRDEVVRLRVSNMGDNQLNKSLVGLMEKIEKKKHEIKAAYYENQTDYELLVIAQQIDSIETVRKASNLYKQLSEKLMASRKLMEQIIRLYGSEYFAPNGVCMARSSFDANLISNIQRDIARLNTEADRDELTREFNRRYDELNSKKDEIQEQRAKYLGLLEGDR